uniref:Sulfotransferase n=1 Tax=Monodelphis domestica TaxID=13616 RepID=A0A5F8H860_MONDO
MDGINVIEVTEDISLSGHLCSQESLNIATNFQFQDSDILLVTFPKSGTIWTQYILNLIFNKEKFQNQNSIPTISLNPWLEHINFSESLAKGEVSRSHFITTHLPAKFLVSNLKNSKVRVVYVARNPKDVLVSYYHFHNFVKFLPDIGSFDNFFDQFLEGKVVYGSWFNHIKGWLGVQHELNFFVITYEELSQKPHQSIQSLANFLGKKLEPEDVETILHYCSFSFMSQNNPVKINPIFQPFFDHSKGQFFRKGIIENWKEYLSPEQNIRFNKVYQAEMGELTFKFPWSLD